MTKINAPKFIIGANELAKPGQLYLTHTQEPQFIAEIIPFEGDILTFEELRDKYPIAARTNRIKGSYFVANVLMIFDSKQYETEQQRADVYSKLMSRTGDWLFNYFKNMSDGNTY